MKKIKVSIKGKKFGKWIKFNDLGRRYGISKELEQNFALSERKIEKNRNQNEIFFSLFKYIVLGV